tara:strand:- start:143 stop:571 length:429 start_codon:yes stop_codon:yes gene_type:complete
MKNLILNWLGVSPWAINNFEGDGRLPSAVSHIVRKEVAKLGFTKLNGNGGLFDLVHDELNRTYDLEGMYSNLDDIKNSLEDLESNADRWDDMSDKLEDMDMEAIVEEVGNQVDFDKVQELDDRLTELLAGYKLEVKLTQENY